MRAALAAQVDVHASRYELPCGELLYLKNGRRYRCMCRRARSSGRRCDEPDSAQPTSAGSRTGSRASVCIFPAQAVLELGAGFPVRLPRYEVLTVALTGAPVARRLTFAPAIERVGAGSKASWPSRLRPSAKRRPRCWENDRVKRLDLGSGGAEGNRTLDLRIANATLSQLSYRPDEARDSSIVVRYDRVSAVNPGDIHAGYRLAGTRIHAARP